MSRSDSPKNISTEETEGKKENVIGVVFNTTEDEKTFFSQFVGSSKDGTSEPITGTTIWIKGEEGKEDSVLLTVYFFRSTGDGIGNDVNAFITDAYVQSALDGGWIKDNVVYQGDRNVKDKTFLREFIQVLYSD